MCETLQDLRKRAKTVEGTIGVIVSDPNYGEVYVKTAFRITTYRVGQSLVGFNAEGIYGAFAWDGALNGDLLFYRLRDAVAKAYSEDCETS
jgi:hypothetical protein